MTAMRVFTYIRPNGDSIPIAQRIEQEGHRVQFYINAEDARRAGDGLITKHSESGELVSKGGRLNSQVLDKVLHPSPDSDVTRASWVMLPTGLADRLRC